MMRFYTAAIFVVLFVKGSTGACPDGWFQNGPSCYYYSGNDGIGLPWHEAQSKCQTMAGALVVIDDEVENNFIYNQMGNGIEAWIGLHDLNQEDSWQWVDGSDLTYIAWASGQPDNWEDAAASQEDCVAIMQSNGGLWNDASCNIGYYFFCERSENAVESPNCQEDNGWEEFEGRCYVIQDSKVAWVEAESACKAIEANLVAIGTQTEQLYVANVVNLWNQHIWIGLSSVSHPDHQLYWSNGDVYTQGTSYDNWLSGPPVLDPNSDNCVEIDPSTSYEGPWSVERCGEGHAYMCERAFTGTCADGWRLYDGFCYLYAIAETTWESWIAADGICQAMGAKLLKIDNDDLEKYITVHLPDFKDAGALGVWLGFSDTDTDGVFVWTDGQIVDNGYKIFGPNQPRDQVGAYDCGQMFTGSSSGVWETDDCFKRQGYICQIPTGKDPTPLDPPASVNQGCDPGWLGFGSHCYYFERSNSVSWDQSEQNCADSGGHLASIVSAEENAFVTGHLSANVWLGGNDLVTATAWTWVDDSPWAFDDWYSGEPNCPQCCLQVWKDANYKWDDTPCNNAHLYVCKKQKIDCWEPLGMEDGRILDTEITASSIYGPGSEATEARLNNVNDGTAVGAWSPQLVYADCPAIPTDQRLDCGGGGEQPCLDRGCCFDDSVPGVIWCFHKGTVPVAGTEWLQVKLVPERTVSGVATQGRPSDVNEFVKSYQVSYSTDGTNFQFVKGRSGGTQTFSGNSDTSTAIANKFNAPVLASYIRIYPYDYNLYPSLRLEVMGCSLDGGDLATPSPNEACTSVTATERLDCGYGGITPAECVNKGCCWDNSISGVKWCFYGKDQYDPRCGKDWQFDPHGEIYCYHFNDYSLRTWQHARDYCMEMGGDLLSVNSKAEQSYVSGQLVTLVMTHALWIGANRNDGNSGWKWSNGQPFNYLYWEDGEPNGAESNEHCVEAYTSNAKWNDINCANERGMVCKKFANIVPPISIDQNEYVINICEGETYTLGCPGMQIVVHHASYGRSNIETCSSDQGVPSEGCHSEDSLDIVSQMCNNLETCTLTASNEVFGDPCDGIYKYLNVIYSCEEKECYGALGVENGSIADAQISQSTYLDNQHKGIDGRLNGPRSWATTEQQGAYMQVTFPSNIRVTGVIVQGANDANRYVTSFTVAFANDDTYQQWTDYTNFDKTVMNFTGNSDQQTPVRVVLAEHVFTAGIRIQPQSWVGDMIGMRLEITGCNPLRELQCSELGDTIWAADEVNDVTVIQAECPGLCPLSTGIPAVYGTDIYAGSSEVCNAAVHAGVILDRFGGLVTIVKKEAQSSYQGSVRNGITSFDETYYPVAFAFAGNEETCEIGWKPFSSFCYYFGEERLPWAEAEAKCGEMGAHLVSIRDSVEQDFLAQQIILQDFPYWWTGLNDLRSYNEFEWSDGEPVLYTNWGAASPDNYEGKMENCVEMCQETQRWDDYLCDQVSGYICKKYKDFYTADQSVAPTPPAGCPDGWSAYEGMCYLFQRDLVAEEDSENFCWGLGGQNVHVQNKYVQSFLHTIIGSEDWRWWIGLHAHVTTDTGVSWEWESGDPVTYDNWGVGNPNIDLGECTVFYGGQFGQGMWYSHRCEKQAYSICERPRDGWTVPPVTTPAPSGGCKWDWSTPDESSGFCYKVYAPEAAGEWDKKQGWENARHQCLTEGGDLVSLHSKDDEMYLIDELSKIGVVSTSVWIGLNDRDKVGWSWSDDTPVEYLSWNVGSPSSVEDNSCVAMKFEPTLGTGLWDNLNCHQALDWICRRPKGIDVIEPTNPPTGKPNTACGSSNDGTWIEYEGMCYLFNDMLPVDVHTAQRTCQTTGGELASIHTIAESAFITNQIKQMPRVDRFWIGLREMGGVNGQYEWTDGTPVDFVNWSEGEPNDAVGIEQCVTTIMNSGRWNDDNCGLKRSGFICKKYLGAPPNPPGPTDPWPGGCPANWLMYTNYCYQIHGENDVCDPAVTDKPECAATWRGAVEYCKSVGGALTSIHDKYENAFITAQSIRAYHNLWIGISDTQWGLYTWANGDEVTYTNWNEGEPNHQNGEENCGELYHAEALAGRWNDKNCDTVTPFICSMSKDPQTPPGLELNQNTKCPSGWVQYNTIQDNYVCYFLDSTPRSFDDAQQNCRNLNGDLASLQTMFDQHFITSYLRGQTAWIGMKQNQDTQDWVWVDGWPVWISNWGENQPTSDTSKSCVINVDSVFGSEWLTADCNQIYPSVCKTSTEEIPPTPGTVEGSCPDDTWEEYGGFCCKAFVTLNGQNDARSWADAEYECTSYGGHLASFTSRHELEWMLSWYNETETLWIGLRNNGQGGWSWVDGRPVSFTYWNEGEPNNAGEDNEDCVEMYGGSGRWNDINCLEEHGYVCLAPMALGTDENGNVIFYTTPKPPTEEHSESNSGIIAGVVLGILFALILIGGAAFYLYRNRDTASKIADTASEIPTGIVNKLYTLSGNVPEDKASAETPPVHFDKEGGATVDDSNA